MNAKQWAVVLIAITLFSLSELFPPWLYLCNGIPEHSAGYHFLSNPPEVKPICAGSDRISPLPTVLKNSGRLNLQRIVLTILTIGLMLLWDNRRTTLKILIGFLALCLSVVGLMFFVLMIRFRI